MGGIFNFRFVSIVEVVASGGNTQNLLVRPPYATYNLLNRQLYTPLTTFVKLLLLQNFGKSVQFIQQLTTCHEPCT